MLRLAARLPLVPRLGRSSALPVRWASGGGQPAKRPKRPTGLQRALEREASDSAKAASAEEKDNANLRYAIYVASTIIFFIGMSYAAVPLYQAFCQATGYGGTVRKAKEERFKTIRPVPGARPVTVRFTADTSVDMPWKFVPQQSSVRVVPGETALAFYRAYNPTDKPITGVSTYNVTPMRVGVHFNKIQCFCFEEQRLRPREEIDMPIFFFIDPDFVDDPSMRDVREVTLSYTFFRTGEMEATTGEETKVAGAAAGGEDGDEASQKLVDEWTQSMAAKMGISVEEAASRERT